MSADFPFDRAGTAIHEQLGLEGLAVWVCFLAACKRNGVQGQIQYTTDPEGWSVLGCDPATFTLDEFFDLTGRLKVTRRRSRARVKQVIATGWADWQHKSNIRTGDTRKPRSEQQNTDTKGTVDIDKDRDRDKDRDSRTAQLVAMRAALRQRTGQPITIAARVSEADVIEQLIQLGALPAQIIVGEYDTLIHGKDPSA